MTNNLTPIDHSAAKTLSKLYGMDFEILPERVIESYLEHLEALGITLDDSGFSEQGYMLKSLMSRICILEAAYYHQMGLLANEKLTPKMRGDIIRGASRLHEDLHKTQVLAWRLIQAQSENESPFITPQDQNLIDDRRADNVQGVGETLNLTQVVEAETIGEEVYNVEFRSIKPVK